MSGLCPISSNSGVSEKALVVSSIFPTSSILGRGMLFPIFDPLAYMENPGNLYADSALGGAALAMLILSGTLPVCKPQKSLIASVDEDTVRQVLQSDWQLIQDRDGSSGIKFYQGKHMTVFEHPRFPDVIIKDTYLEKANDMLQSVKSSQAICAEYNLSTCMIPESRVIVLDPSTVLFVMEKVKGTISAYESQEQSESAFDQFSSTPEIETKWREYFRQAAEFICLTGYWDTSWRNILLMENGLGFVDFEMMEVTQRLQKLGINRLLNMAPPQFYKMIFDVAVRHHVFMVGEKEGILKSCDSHTQDLKIRSQVRAWHKKHLVSAKPIDTTLWEKGSLERIILDKFNSELPKNLEDHEGSLIDQRTIIWHCFPVELQIRATAFKQALINLQNANLVCTWEIPNLSTRVIYF